MVSRLKVLLVLITAFNLLTVKSQESYPDCVNPKQITLPFTNEFYAEEQGEIYYQEEDVYTYWYKINVVSDCSFNYKIEPISDDDRYDAIVYRYNGKNFCNDVVLKRKMPLINRSEETLSVEKGNYYIGVLHLKGRGCGHTLALSIGEQSKTIKAVQNNCVEEAIETIVLEEMTEKIDTIPVETLEKQDSDNKIIKGMVINKKTGKSIDATVSILDKDGSIKRRVRSTFEKGFSLANTDENKEIIVSIRKLGYKPVLDTLRFSGADFKIFLNPIKIGEKLVMRKIYFHPNTYVLKDESVSELEKLNQFILENGEYAFEIQGHTNGNRSVKLIDKYKGRGEEWNFKGSAKKLSKLRAEKIKSYLVINGVEPEQVTTVGYGGDRMVIKKPKTMKQAMKNIRVEVIVMGKFELTSN